MNSILPSKSWVCTPGHRGIAAVLILLTTGCSSRVGPKVIENSFSNYGDAIHSVLREELLQNIVRRRHHESPQFVSLSGISQTREVRGSVGVGTTFNRLGFLSADGQASAESIDYPTFSLTPQQGRDFAKNLHDRVPLTILPQLTNAGYPAELIILLLAQEMAGVRGVHAESGDSYRPASPNFVAIVDAIKALEDRNQLKIQNVIWEEPAFEHPFAPEVFSPKEIMETKENGKRYSSLDGGKTFYVTNQRFLPALWISPDAYSSSSGRQLAGLLRIDSSAGRRAWAMHEPLYVQGSNMNPRTTLTVQTRSFYGVLNLLAHGVHDQDNPHDNAMIWKQGYGKSSPGTHTPDIASRFRVYYSPKRPPASFLAVKMKDGWYYIDEDDRSSKQVFNALFDLYQLQVSPQTSGEDSSTVTAPVISIGSR